MQRDVQTHPSRGGSRGYSTDFRALALTLPTGQSGASRSSLWRWQQRLNPLVQTGNGPKTILQGEHKFLLTLYRMAYPKAMASEIICFIAMHSVNPVVYSREDITKCEQELGFTRKVGSTTANQAFLRINIIKRNMFWNMAPPLGINGVNRHVLIDIDEAGIFLTHANRKYGKALSGIEVRQNGIYGHRQKYTLIMAISTARVVHVRFEREAGTTIEIFNQFVTQVCNLIPAQPPRRFLYDNLKSHLNVAIVNTIHAAGHSHNQRAPYMPKDGPIEYAFNMMQQELTNRMHLIHNEQDLRRHVFNIAQGLTGLDALFQHCGY